MCNQDCKIGDYIQANFYDRDGNDAKCDLCFGNNSLRNKLIKLLEEMM